MAWKVTADPVRFDEAVEWFRSRIPLTDELLEKLRAWAGDRAWTIAGVAELDVVLDVYRALDDAIENHRTVDEFKRAVRDKLEASWGGAKAGRIELIFQNNVQTAYNRGRYSQMKEVADLRPYWMFDAILDSRTTRICQTRNKTVLPQSDPWWDSNYPPLHHACRSSVRALTADSARERGVATSPPQEHPPSGGFGKSPAVSEGWTPDSADYPPELWEIFQKKQKK